MNTLSAIDTTGDTKTSWDPGKPAEVEVARNTFDQLKQRGYMAYSLSGGGERGELLTEFDPSLGSIIMVPRQVGG
jgi:hypothetical protein